MKVWIDPPSGWQFGFPKVWNPEVDKDVMVWLVKEGYPQAEIDSLGESFYFRSWEATDQPTDFRKGVLTKKGKLC
jgi:hypothetical protein